MALKGHNMALNL